jgi:hypothetical protein
VKRTYAPSVGPISRDERQTPSLSLLSKEETSLYALASPGDSFPKGVGAGKNYSYRLAFKPWKTNFKDNAGIFVIHF